MAARLPNMVAMIPNMVVKAMCDSGPLEPWEVQIKTYSAYGIRTGFQRLCIKKDSIAHPHFKN